MKKFFQEFKEFALKGNVMDMAIGVIIGGAFGGIVAALTADFINPLLASIGGTEIGGVIKLPWVDYSKFETAEEKLAVSLNWGDFLTQVINFIILALVLFLLIKGMNKLFDSAKKLVKKKKDEEEAAAPTTKICPFCKSEINIEACKCPHCTSDQPKEAEA